MIIKQWIFKLTHIGDLKITQKNPLPLTKHICKSNKFITALQYIEKAVAYF